ncbi:MAG: heat-inducible transcriptional repressor HrcA [Lactobacillales bacterium]|jgi:heat-inducible transcriptional repressor|nr:heat-inducible transcriptional repressor HrcA [Lactobacillales bacterium]
MLSERQLQIFALIVQHYAANHVPIGSKRLMEEEGVKASSATIRNELNFLEDYGLLLKNHVSSGRIPSLQGFRYYVDHLLKIETLNSALLQQIRDSLQEQFVDIGEMVRKSAVALSNLTHYTAFSFGLGPESQVLTDFRIMMLNPHQALAVMITDSGHFENNVVSLPYGVSREDLERLMDVIRDRLLGETMLSVQSKLRTEFPMILQRYFVDPQSMIELLEDLWRDAFIEEVYVSGRVNLFDSNLISTPLALKQLYSFFNDSNQVLRLIQETKVDSDGFGIRIGEELGNELFLNMTLLTATYEIAEHGNGILAILGPASMQYNYILSVMSEFCKELSKKSEEYYRYLGKL